MASLAVLALLALAPVAWASDDPPERAPDARAPAHKVFRWKSKGDLRFTWVLPKGYNPKEPRNLTVICHGTGLDYRWGHWNNKPGIFRPDDIVISVDGPSPGGNNTRLFLGKPADAKAIHELLRELRTTFTVDRVFLYGHSQGGFFVVYYAGEYPDDVAGVVAHASGAWNWSKTGNDVKRVAIAFMHGTMDPVVPYRQSRASRDHYAKLKFPLLHLRRLSRYNHWPNAVRASETLAWCDGMTTSDPKTALAAARSILEPKRPDEYQWQTTVGYAGAWEILERFTADGERAFENPDAKLVASAKELREQIDAAGAQHVKVLAKHLTKKSDLALDGEPWLGHLVPLREDFRGVPSVEKLLDGIGFDACREKQSKSIAKILDSWYGKNDPEDIYRAIVQHLPHAFLSEGLPPELGTKMAEWHKDAKKLKLSRRDLAKFELFEHWQRGWREGLEAYEKIWKKWKLGS